MKTFTENELATIRSKPFGQCTAAEIAAVHKADTEKKLKAKRENGVRYKKELEAYCLEKYSMPLADIFTASGKTYMVDGSPWNGMRPYPKGFTERVEKLRADAAAKGKPISEEIAKRKAKAEFENKPQAGSTVDLGEDEDAFAKRVATIRADNPGMTIKVARSKALAEMN